MAGQRIGYVRVSTLGQNEERQFDGQALDRTLTDKAAGRDTVRSRLTELLLFARDGDTIYASWPRAPPRPRTCANQGKRERLPAPAAVSPRVFEERPPAVALSRGTSGDLLTGRMCE